MPSAVQIMLQVTSIAGVLCYALAAWQLWRSLRSDHRPAARAPAIAYLAALLHGASIVFIGVRFGGLSASFFDALSIAAFLIVVSAFISLRQQAYSPLLLPVFVIALTSMLLGLAFATHTPIVAESAGMLLHILSSIIAYSLLSLATLHALLLMLLERELRHPHASVWLEKLPPLLSLESMLFKLIALGWLALTVAIGSGAVFIEDIFAQHLSHKTTFSMISWAMFTVLLAGRQLFGWRSGTAIRWTFGAFLALILAYFGSKFVLEIILNRS